MTETTGKRAEQVTVPDRGRQDGSGVDQVALLTACRRLVRLLDEPYPGTASWHVFCVNAVDAIRAAVNQDIPKIVAALRDEGYTVTGPGEVVWVRDPNSWHADGERLCVIGDRIVGSIECNSGTGLYHADTGRDGTESVYDTEAEARAAVERAIKEQTDA